MEFANEHAKWLRPRWNTLCSSLGVLPERGEKWWGIIESRHCEPQRRYHTLEHLVELFGHADNYATALQDRDAVGLAIFFHDAIYNPKVGSPGNERASADLFDVFGQEALPAREPPGLAKGHLIAKVKTWIIKTADHKVHASDDNDCKLFMDFDMAILGSSWERYEEYFRQIRIEYGHVADILFWKARGDFLKTVVETGSIYATGSFQVSHESQAKQNMSRESSLLLSKFETRPLPCRLGASLATATCSKKHLKSIGMGSTATLVSGLCWISPCGVSAICGIMALLLGACITVGSRFERYPYKHRGSDSQTVLLAGSYNPPHFGHLEMIKHLSRTHRKVVALIGVNSSKSYQVSPYQRLELLKLMVHECQLNNVEVAVWGSATFLYGKSVGATLMYRGIRSWPQDGRAEKGLELLNWVYPLVLGYSPISTAYLQAAPEMEHISSTVVRNAIANGDPITDFVPAGCADWVKQAYA